MQNLNQNVTQPSFHTHHMELSTNDVDQSKQRSHIFKKAKGVAAGAYTSDA